MYSKECPKGSKQQGNPSGIGGTAQGKSPRRDQPSETSKCDVVLARQGGLLDGWKVNVGTDGERDGQRDLSQMGVGVAGGMMDEAGARWPNAVGSTALKTASMSCSGKASLDTPIK
ncbi:hypothetical protein [Cupriavidus necator]|jgi:hypothetical protein|uniref:hypothetical protein n=1 Tax=Cupriavidus necator TaxID=106590 RepID=UPI0013050F82|nr:hypothetical protein [Cupriavidus necator]MDX6007899.1 hypothetical protein [Cupriavidus necator]